MLCGACTFIFSSFLPPLFPAQLWGPQCPWEKVSPPSPSPHPPHTSPKKHLESLMECTPVLSADWRLGPPWECRKRHPTFVSYGHYVEAGGVAVSATSPLLCSPLLSRPRLNPPQHANHEISAHHPLCGGSEGARAPLLPFCSPASHLLWFRWPGQECGLGVLGLGGGDRVPGDSCI